MSNAGEGDKRKVTTDALETLGTVIGPNERRDAIHIAVEPTVAKEALTPGDHVTADGRWVQMGDAEAVGIVDPFLPRARVKIGERFWLLVYPRQIHSLRHVWTHPAFTDAPEVAGEAPKAHVDSRAASETWLRDFCSSADCPGYETVIGEIAAGQPNSWDADEYLHFKGMDAHGEIPPEFWKHVEIVLGHKPAHTPAFFSCGC